MREQIDFSIHTDEQRAFNLYQIKKIKERQGVFRSRTRANDVETKKRNLNKKYF